MLHQNVDSVVAQFVLANGQFLKPHIVLEHLSKVNRDTLTNRLVNGVVDIEFFESVVAAVQHGKDTDDSVVVDFIVAKIERKQLVVREEQFCHHHRAVRLDFVQVQVKHLKVGAFFQSFGKVLRTFALDVVALQV
jgi:hypothetical protein